MPEGTFPDIEAAQMILSKKIGYTLLFSAVFTILENQAISENGSILLIAVFQMARCNIDSF